MIDQSENQPLSSQLPAICHLCAIATMEVLNQDVCISIASMSTPATGAITSPKSPTSIIKPSFVPAGSGLHIDPTQPYMGSEHDR